MTKCAIGVFIEECCLQSEFVFARPIIITFEKSDIIPATGFNRSDKVFHHTYILVGRHQANDTWKSRRIRFYNTSSAIDGAVLSYDQLYLPMNFSWLYVITATLTLGKAAEASVSSFALDRSGDTADITSSKPDGLQAHSPKLC